MPGAVCVGRGINPLQYDISDAMLTVFQVELKEGMKVVFLGKQHYGCVATVLPDLGKGLTKQGAVEATGGQAVQ